ncbi:fumarylacetoacetate hydrolase family protein [Cryobacterium soli]|uniref:fumarylacetoacetate hydrolase family protein n=1 Tax=Cryobacterium soli TaxID=2220095 RepID=UPI000E745A47|nr:fumarylacetoacetate hydrolase family protein [Cryobacterium soli]
MRLVTHAHPSGDRAAAVVASSDGDRLVDLDGLSLVEILQDETALAAARLRVEHAAGSPETLPRLSDTRLLPPVRPGKILCLGYNYRGHVAEGADPTADDPAFPDVFVKTPNVVNAPGDPVVLPVASTNVDYEGEIAVVIGRRAHRVPLVSALDYVAGYALFNDVSDRDWQGRSSQWELGKCFDGFGPLGPELITADEIPDPQDLLLEVERDGVVTVSQSTATMIFPMAFIVHYLSQVMTLEPGDIISTGTPQKLPQALNDHRPLGPGDAVTIRVAGLGELTTTFTAPTDTERTPA